MPLITTTTGKQFVAHDGESLLDAAMRANVALAYGCRTGRCSSCKSRIRDGATLALHGELGLSAEDREAGWILSCVRTATSDLLLDAEDLGDVQVHPARTWPCRIQSLTRMAPDVIRVTLRLPPTASLNYHAGQYLDVIGTLGIRRSYSIANVPATNPSIELHVRQVTGGALSSYWFERARPNDLLRVHGPLGTFFLRAVAGLDLVFLATGTGIAPVKAMLEALEQMPSEIRPRSISVYWGGREYQDLYWDSSVLNLEHRLVAVLSRADADWTGARGHVQQALLADRPDLTNTVVYACGSDTMIRDAHLQLRLAGLPEGRFHSDAFVCSGPEQGNLS